MADLNLDREELGALIAPPNAIATRDAFGLFISEENLAGLFMGTKKVRIIAAADFRRRNCEGCGRWMDGYPTDLKPFQCDSCFCP